MTQRRFSLALAVTTLALASVAVPRPAHAEAVGYKIVHDEPNKYNLQYAVMIGWGGANLKSAALAADLYYRPLSFLAVQGSAQVPIVTGGRAFYFASGGIFLHFPIDSDVRVLLAIDHDTKTFVDIPDGAVSRWGLDGGFMVQRNGFPVGTDDDVAAKSVNLYAGLHWRKQADFMAEVDGYGRRGNLSILDIYAHVVQEISHSYGDLSGAPTGADAPKEHKYGARIGASGHFAHTAGIAMKAEIGATPGPVNGGFYFFLGLGFGGGAAL